MHELSRTVIHSKWCPLIECGIEPDTEPAPTYPREQRAMNAAEIAQLGCNAEELS